MKDRAEPALVERYLDEAVRFVPRGGGGALRVATTLVTCRLAVLLLDAMALPPEPASSYRYVNVHNPDCPLRFDSAARRWCCPAALAEHPAWGINWAGARLLCQRLGARLPTASEWERFAANDTPERAYPWGDAPPDPERANYDEHYGGTTEVGRFAPTEIGLFDVAGNLGEWCLDRHEPGTSLERVVKGGAWSKDARHLRIAASRGKWGRLGTTTIGLRPVWSD